MNSFGWDLPTGCNTAEINHHFGDEEMQVCPDCKGEGDDGWEQICPTCKGEGEVPVTPEDIEDRKADAADHERDVEQEN